MAQIESPKPQYLYRFRSLKDDENNRVVLREISAMRERYLWCARYRSLNDPMEGFYDPTTALVGDANYRMLARSIFEEKQDVGIACFSEALDNVLMWTHYAGNYSGICIKYSFDRLLNGLPREALLVRVAYDEAPPLITPDDVANSRTAACKILSQKRYNWAYEREWRVLANPERVTTGNREVIEGIYLGSRISGEDRHAITSRFQSSDIQISQMRIRQYSHEWEEL